ncbi:tetratricopeptide repeat protein [Persephonella sp.]
MKKILYMIPAGIIVFTGCAKQEDVNRLERKLVSLQKEVAQLKEEQEETKDNLKNLSIRVDNVSQIASKNSLEIEKIKLAKKPENLETLEEEGAEKVKVPEDPADLYKYALNAYYKGKTEEARKYFEIFVENYSDSDMYDNALFWIGQTYYTEGNYKKAIEAFDRLITECETGKAQECNKYPVAMLKKAYSYIKLGEIEEAKKILKKIVRRFPDTEEAELATRKLEVLE